MIKLPRIETRSVADLRRAEYNPRKISEVAAAGLRRSLERWGLVEVPVWNERSGTLVGGHQRIDILEAAGVEETPVVVVDLDDGDERALNVTLNNRHIQGDFDWPVLRGVLDTLDTWDPDAFEALQLGVLAEDIPPVAIGEDPYQPPDDADGADPTTKPGDVWGLGRHVVVCGDCREGSIARGVDAAGGRVNMAFTSPPYAAQREYDASSGFRPIPPGEYVEWFAPVASAVAGVLAVDGSWFVNIKPSADGLDTSLYVFDLVIAHVRLWGWHFATEFCWERPGVPKSVTQRFKNQFEPIYQFARGRWKMRPKAVRHQSDAVHVPFGEGVGNTSWGNARQGKKNMIPNATTPGLAYPGNRIPTFGGADGVGHSAAFPTGLPTFFIRAFTDPDDVVLDPFGGSGTTLIACEREGRACVTTEISPAYCDTIIGRWERETGSRAEKL